MRERNTDRKEEEKTKPNENNENFFSKERASGQQPLCKSKPGLFIKASFNLAVFSVSLILLKTC